MKLSKIDPCYNIYRVTNEVLSELPLSIEIENHKFFRFMNHFYIPDYVYNLNADYVIALNEMRYLYKDKIIDYEYNRATLCRILENLPLNLKTNNVNILDFGCGEGIDYNIISSYLSNFRLYGVDIRKIDLMYLKEYNSFKQINIDEQLPFKNGYFDIIIALFVFHFKITDIQIESMYNKLSDDGLLCFNLIKSADKRIINRLELVGFKLDKNENNRFKNNLIVDCYIMRKNNI